jgi:hypothetical protein
MREEESQRLLRREAGPLSETLAEDLLRNFEEFITRVEFIPAGLRERRLMVEETGKPEMRELPVGRLGAEFGGEYLDGALDKVGRGLRPEVQLSQLFHRPLSRAPEFVVHADSFHRTYQRL